MARMRTLDEAHKLLLEEDPGCAVTKYALRQMVLGGEVPFILVGKTKRLINYDALLEKLENPEPPPAPVQPVAGIRPVPERPWR